MVSVKVRKFACYGIHNLCAFFDKGVIGIFGAVYKIVKIKIIIAALAICNIRHIYNIVFGKIFRSSNFSAVCFKLSEKPFGIFKEKVVPWQNNGRIFFLAYNKIFSFYFAVPLHQYFITQVKIYMLSFKLNGKRQKIVVKLF